MTWAIGWPWPTSGHEEIFNRLQAQKLICVDGQTPSQLRQFEIVSGQTRNLQEFAALPSTSGNKEAEASLHNHQPKFALKFVSQF